MELRISVTQGDGALAMFDGKLSTEDATLQTIESEVAESRMNTGDNVPDDLRSRCAMTGNI